MNRPSITKIRILRITFLFIFVPKSILEFIPFLCYIEHKDRHLTITDAYHTDSILLLKWMLPSMTFYVLMDTPNLFADRLGIFIFACFSHLCRQATLSAEFRIAADSSINVEPMSKNIHFIFRIHISDFANFYIKNTIFLSAYQAKNKS